MVRELAEKGWRLFNCMKFTKCMEMTVVCAKIKMSFIYILYMFRVSYPNGKKRDPITKTQPFV